MASTRAATRALLRDVEKLKASVAGQTDSWVCIAYVGRNSVRVSHPRVGKDKIVSVEEWERIKPTFNHVIKIVGLGQAANLTI